MNRAGAGLLMPLAAALLFMISTPPIMVQAAPDPPMEIPNEAVLKAAFIYNFTKFTTWQPDSCNPEHLIIGVFSSDPVSANLKMLEGRKSGSKIIKVVRIQDGIKSACVDLIYLPTLENLTNEDLNFMKQRHILLISEGRNSVAKGAIIAIYRVNNKIRFDINLEAARDSGIDLSSRLLNLAGRVIR